MVEKNEGVQKDLLEEWVFELTNEEATMWMAGEDYSWERTKEPGSRNKLQEFKKQKEG